MSKSLHVQAIKRVGANLLLLVGIFVLPWWLTVLVGCVFLFNFKTYLEFIVAMVILTLTYFDVSGHVLVYSLIPLVAVAVLLAVEFLKTRLSGYER